MNSVVLETSFLAIAGVSLPAMYQSISWQWAIPVVLFALGIVCVGFTNLHFYLWKRGIIQSGRSVFSRERELTGWFLPPQLEKLNLAAYEAFWSVTGQGGVNEVYGRFMCAINLIDTEKQLHGNPVDSSDLPVGTVGQGESVFSFTPLKSTVGVGDGTTYLLELMHHRSNIIHKKILYEYQRKNGSLTYWLYDKKPLLTMAELVRQLPDEERGAFLKYCQQLEATEKARFGKEAEVHAT